MGGQGLLAAAGSAGGAPIDQLAILAFVYIGGTGALVWLIRAHRAGRTQLLARAAAVTSFVFRAPGWSALPVSIAAGSLLLTMGGGFWDIGYHIDYGRDDGPLGNPGHYPLLIGFFGTLAAGILCIGLADERDRSGHWIRITREWHVPIGGALLIGCSAFGLTALPLDDVWHRIFGQDVTLWSPTHFMLLGGATMSVIAMCVLIAEGALASRNRPSTEQPSGSPWARFELLGPDRPIARFEFFRGGEFAARAGKAWSKIQRFALLGGMLVGLEAFLAEFDWGVPLYRQVWQPLLLMAFAAFVFSAARGWAGRGGAMGGWGFYIVIRSAASLIPVLAGRSLAVVPLLLVPAICVELVALRVSPRTRPIAFGVLAGLFCGTLGFAAEYGWSNLVYPLPWGPDLIAEGLISATVAAISGGVLGGLLAAALRRELPTPRAARIACIGAFAAFVAIGVSAGLRELPVADVTVELTNVSEEPRREALATFRIEPASAAQDANWLYMLAWQGGPGTQRIVDRLEPLGDGVYRSTQPIPLHGSWKSGLRLQQGRARGAVPLRLPTDGELGGAGAEVPTSFTLAEGPDIFAGASGAELPAPASFRRPFLEDGLIMLRESRGDVPPWLWVASASLIALIYGVFITGIAVGVSRLARRSGPAQTVAAEDDVAATAPQPRGFGPSVA